MLRGAGKRSALGKEAGEEAWSQAPLGAPSQSPTPAVHSRPQGQPPSRPELALGYSRPGPHRTFPAASDASSISGDHRHQTKASTRVMVLVQEKGQSDCCYRSERGLMRLLSHQRLGVRGTELPSEVRPGRNIFSEFLLDPQMVLECPQGRHRDNFSPPPPGLRASLEAAPQAHLAPPAEFCPRHCPRCSGRCKSSSRRPLGGRG